MTSRTVVVGNRGNVGIRLTKWLRDFGVEAFLVLSVGSNHPRSQIWNDYPELAETLPSWVILVQEQHAFAYRHRVQRLLRTQNQQIRNVIVIGPEISVFSNIGERNIFIPTGSEVNWQSVSEKWFPTKLRTQGGLIRSNIRKMDFGIAAQENTYYILQALMGRDKVVSLGFPSSQRDQQQTIAPDDMAQARKLASSCEKLILFPSRKNWGDSSKGYDKGTKRFICAYEKWRNSNEASDHKVICPIHGNKSKEFRRQLEARVPLEQWVVSNGNLSRSFLYALMCQENAILMDHFHDVGRSVISGVAREALAFGTPLVSSLDIHGDLFSAAYGPDCPIYKASSEGEIVAALEKITGMSRFELRSWRERITNWHYKNLSPESFVDRLQPYLL